MNGIYANWQVPLTPATNNGANIVYFFPALQNASANLILQPVLAFNGLDGQGGQTSGWTISSWDCCDASQRNIMSDTPEIVYPGDNLAGSVVGTNCNTSTGVCSTWSVSVQDSTFTTSANGQITNNTLVFGANANEVVAGALEDYYIASCPLLPASLSTVFTGVDVTNMAGGNIPPSSMNWTNDTAAKTPNCAPTASFAIVTNPISSYTNATVGWWPSSYGKPSAPTACGVLAPGHGLIRGQSLYSCDGRFKLTIQGTDGNVVLSEGSTVLWATNHYGSGVSYPAEQFVMQSDGNLVQYSPTAAVWSSATSGSVSGLSVQNDGNMAIYDTGGHAIWSTHTCCH